jgi:hypothetical protein
LNQIQSFFKSSFCEEHEKNIKNSVLFLKKKITKKLYFIALISHKKNNLKPMFSYFLLKIDIFSFNLKKSQNLKKLK